MQPGQLVRIPIRDGINVDEKIWGPSASKFRPERWLENALPDSGKDIHAPWGLLTFGDGYVSTLRLLIDSNTGSEMLQTKSLCRQAVCLGRVKGKHIVLRGRASLLT